jgi:hypothetical protein
MIWSHTGEMTDWLCTVEFLPTDDLAPRMFTSDIIGYLIGYAHLTNTLSLDADACVAIQTLRFRVARLSIPSLYGICVNIYIFA